MNCPETKNELRQKIRELKEKAEKIVDKGVIGEGPFKLQNTLESHEKIKNLFEELDFLLEKDIPEERVLVKISSIEKVLDSMQSESER